MSQLPTSKKILIFFLLSLMALILQGCQAGLEKSNSVESTASQIRISDIEIQTEPQSIQFNTPTKLIFLPRDEKNEIIKNLSGIGELHLIIVSRDLNDFYHLKPTQREDGAFLINDFIFPSGGDYKIYAEIESNKFNAFMRTFDLKISGPERESSKIKPDDNLQKELDGLIISLRNEGKLVAGEPIVLRYRVVESASRKPIQEFDEYLGEKAHFIAINEGLNEFLHSRAHEAGRSYVKHNHDHQESSTHEQEDEMLLPISERATFLAELIFPKEGIYKIWAEFMHDGKLFIVPFVVDIQSTIEDKSFSEVKIPDDSFKVLITNNGFRPNQIEYKRGKPLTLAFVRLGNETCGDEIVFDKLGIRLRDIPTGEAVTAQIPTEEEGTFNFRCGKHNATIKITR